MQGEVGITQLCLLLKHAHWGIHADAKQGQDCCMKNLFIMERQHMKQQVAIIRKGVSFVVTESKK